MARTLKDLKIKAGRVLAGKNSADALPVVSKNYNDLLDYIEELETIINSDTGFEYDYYLALLTQTGTNPPTVTVIKNTLGEDPTWHYDFYNEGVGRYQGRFASNILTENKTVAFIQNIKLQAGNSAVTVNTYDTSIQTGLFDEISISTHNGAGSYANGILQYTTLEVRVYP
jgi:hypothetical protein